MARLVKRRSRFLVRKLGCNGEQLKIRKVARPRTFVRVRVRSGISGRRLPSAHYYFQAHKAPLDGFSISEEGDGARKLVFTLFFPLKFYVR